MKIQATLRVFLLMLLSFAVGVTLSNFEGAKKFGKTQSLPVVPLSTKQVTKVYSYQVFKAETTCTCKQVEFGEGPYATEAKCLAQCPAPEKKDPTTPTDPAVKETCSVEKWKCGDWSTCSKDSLQTRTCDSTKVTVECPAPEVKAPPTRQKCTPVIEPVEPKPTETCTADKWECGGWSVCSKDALQTRSCKIVTDCPGVETASPAIKQKCTPPEEPVEPKPTEKCTDDQFECSEWSTCSKDSLQTRICKVTKAGNCPVDKKKTPETSQTCTPEAITIVPPRLACDPKTLQCVEDPKGIYSDQESCSAFCKAEIVAETASTETTEEQESPQESFDTDQDGVSDQEEIAKNTDPFDPDTDGDGLSDRFDEEPLLTAREEVVAAMDRDENGIPDAIQQTIQQGGIDTDGDGLSNTLEQLFGTDPNSLDSDGDGTNDADEALLTGTNPNDRNDTERDDTFRIANLYSGLTIGSRAPVTIVTPKEVKEVEIFAYDTRGNKFFLCQTKTTENRRALCVPKQKLKRGKYQLFVKALDTGAVAQSIVVTVEDDEILSVKIPQPKKLNNIDLPSEPLQLENLKFTIVLTENNPFAKVGGTTALGTVVHASWTSVLFTSALIADVAGGEFNIQSPQKLEPGDHKVVLYARRPQDNVVSSAVQINFTVTTEGEITDITKVPLGEDSSGSDTRGAATQEQTKAPIIPIAIGVVIFLAILGIIVVLKKK